MPAIAGDAKAAPDQKLVILNSVADLRSTAPAKELVFCKGFLSPGDGGGGLFFWSPQDDQLDDGAIVVSHDDQKVGRWVREFTSGEIDVRWFGAKGDGRTDDTAAFEHARDFGKRRARREPQVATDPLGSVKIKIPAGTYLITRPEALLDRAWPTSTLGLCYEGLGPGISAIDYRPSQPGSLLFNNNAVLFLRLSGILFACNDGVSVFYESISSGKAQDVRCEDVVWNGSWSTGFKLTGTNTNSEYKWTACTIAGGWDYFLDLDGNDQLLNYWFHNCKFWATRGGGWIRAKRGGHIKVSDCDVSGWKETRGRALFALLGTTHARGVCHFLCIGSRFEIQTDSTPVLQSQWPHGVISFVNADFGSQAPWRSPDYIEALIEIGAAGHAMLRWQDCTHIGRHSYRAIAGSNPNSFRELYRYLTDPLRIPPRILADYTGGTHLAVRSCDEMILLDPAIIGTSLCPIISFHNCRSERVVGGQWTLPWNSTLTWSMGIPAIVPQRTVACPLRSNLNSNPIGNFPARALITKVQLYVFNQGAFGPGSKVVVKGKEQDVICTFEAKDSVQHSYFLDDRVGYLVDGPSGLITATTQLSPAAISGADPWGVLLIDFVG